MLIKDVLYKESSYEISLKLDEKFIRGISYSGQIVFFQFLHYTCFSSAICPLQVPALATLFRFRSFLFAVYQFKKNIVKVYFSCRHLVLFIPAYITCLYICEVSGKIALV